MLLTEAMAQYRCFNVPESAEFQRREQLERLLCDGSCSVDDCDPIAGTVGIMCPYRDGGYARELRRLKDGLTD